MLVNNNEFLIKDSEIPKVPVEFSEDALLWYREQKKRCIEGYSVGGKWMPPQLYFYINFWKIELQRGKSKSKVVDRPMLRDVEWEIFLPYIVCRGLSGFDDIEISEKQEVVLDAIKNGSFSGVPNYNNQALDLEIMTARETGKANWCESTCYTPYGKKRWGDLSVGDYIFGNDGNPTQILKVFPQGKIPLYKITLRDGRETICSGEHLWNVYTKTPGYLRHIYGNRMIKTLTTNDLIKNFKIDRKKCYKNKNGFEARYYLPTSDAVKFNINKNHYISPYILGALIGDGGLTINVTIVNNDIEVISNICNELDDLHLLKKIESAKYGYNIISKQKSGGNKLKNELRRLGLFGKKSTHKFIPEEYLYSSIENRMSLLQGLMDTDGYIDEKGLIEFGTTSEQLSKDIMFLCRSLGINCKYTKSKLLYTNNTCYRVRIYTDKNIFRIKRKLNRIKPRTKFSASRIERNAIVDIKYVFDDDAMCVMVDNDSHLYLIDDFIVTHNSFCASALIAHEWLFNGQRSYIDNTSIDFRKTKSNITVGAGDSKLSSRLMIKVKLGLDCLAKSGIQFGGVYYPHPFFQRYTGSFNAGKSIVAKYTKKVGNSWIDEGSFSAINHVSYKDNPFAAQGSRNNLMIKEEIGMFSNLEAAYNADVETMMSGTNKYGTCVYIGCVCAGTKLWDKYGNLVNIENIKKENGILGFNNDGAYKENIEYIKEPQKKPCYRITTKNATIIECSEDHPILWSKSGYVYSNRETINGKREWKNSIKKIKFKETKDLKVGDQLCLINSIPIFGEKEMWNPRLIGLLIGDGSYGFDKTPILSNCDNEINEYIDENFDTKIEKQYQTKENKIYRDTRIKNICGNLRDVGIYGQTKNNKTLPKNIYSYNKESLSEMIGGLFDTDGTVSYSNNKKSLVLSLCSSNKNLLYEIKYLLIKFGIHCNIIEVKVNKKKEQIKKIKSINNYFNLVIADCDSVYNFYKNIKFLCKYKQDRLNESPKYIIKKTKFARKHNAIFTTKNGDWNNVDITDINGIRFETVKSIEYIGEQFVYNLTTDYTHTYIANNIITHNTGGDMESGTIGAYKMFYSPRTFDMLPFYDKWENKGEIGLFIPATMRPNEFKDDNGNTNFEQATKFFVEKREELRSKKNSANSLDEHIQYNPLVPSEAFLRTSNNIFPVAEMKEWLSEIESKRIYRDAEYICDLVLDDEFDNGIKPQMNPNLRPIYDFPIDKGKDVTGAIIIYFHPDENQQFGRYIAGIDPYDFNKAENSMSLGSMIVMDRLSGYIMCEYSGRPRFADQFYENCRRIAIYYNACVLYENEKQGVKQYFEKKNALGYLMPQPKYIKDIIPTSTVERGFGIHMNQQIKDHGEILLRDWLQTEFEGMLNLKRIRSQTILKELIMYDDVNNFDRVMSMMCLMYALQEMHKQKVITSQSKATDKFFERKLFQKNAIMQYR